MVTLTEPVAKKIYETMVTIRAAEERVLRGLTSGEFSHMYYPVRGHEAIAATLGAVLKLDDYLSTTYRCFADVIAKGASLREVLAEQAGKATGTSKGKGGPMHLCDPDTGVMVTTGIVGAGLPIAVGLALAAKLDGVGQVAVASFGDGATSIGAVHEAMNLAALWNLPLVFLCQNNMWGEHTALHDYTLTKRLADRAGVYGMHGITVDGTEPEALFPVLTEAVDRARTGGGPTFVEAVTLRVLGHSFGIDQPYRSAEELAQAEAKEPVAAFGRYLLQHEYADDAWLERVAASVAEQVDDAVSFANTSPYPQSDEIFTDVFSNDGGAYV